MCIIYIIYLHVMYMIYIIYLYIMYMHECTPYIYAGCITVAYVVTRDCVLPGVLSPR